MANFSPELVKALEKIATEIEAYRKAASLIEIHVSRYFWRSYLDIKVEFKPKVTDEPSRPP